MYYGFFSEASSTFYLIDKRLPDDVVATFANHVVWAWHGEVSPLVLQKIAGIDLSPETTTAHYQRLSKLLPDYIHTHETGPVFDDDEGIDSNETHCLSHLWPAGKIELNFAGPCIMVRIQFSTLDTSSLQQTAKPKLDQLARAFAADYVLVDPKTRKAGITKGMDVSQFIPIMTERFAAETAKQHRQVRGQFLRRVMFPLTNLALLAALLLFCQYAVGQQIFLQGVKTDHSSLFEVSRRTELSGREIAPHFAAFGHIIETGEPVTLDLYLKEFNLIRPGDRLEVYATESPDRPYIFAPYFRSHSPLQIGGYIIPFDMLAAIVFAIALATFWFNYIKQRHNEARRTVLEQKLLRLIYGAGLAFIGILFVVWIGQRWRS